MGKMENFSKKLGFIGAGNMAAAMMSGIVEGNIFPANGIVMSDISGDRLAFISEKYGVDTTSDNTQVAKSAEVVFLAVKPQYYTQVITDIAPVVTEKQLIITIAPGQTLASLSERFGNDRLKIIRTMPNTPAMVGAGVTAVTPNANVTPEELAYARRILGGFGISEVISENLMDAVVAERHGMLSGGNHHRSRARAGGKRIPRRGHGRNEGVYRPLPFIGKIIVSGRVLRQFSDIAPCFFVVRMTKIESMIK